MFAKRVWHPGSPGQAMFAYGVALAEHEFEQQVETILQRTMRELERTIYRHRTTSLRRVA